LKAQASDLAAWQFVDGVSCTDCGKLLVAPGGLELEELWEREKAIIEPGTGPADERCWWVWEIICEECAQ